MWQNPEFNVGSHKMTQKHQKTTTNYKKQTQKYFWKHIERKNPVKR